MFRLYSSDQVGQLLVAQRKAKGLTQAEVAVRLGISQNRWSELENNPAQLTIDRLLAVGALLDLEWFVQERGKTPPPVTDW